MKILDFLQIILVEAMFLIEKYIFLVRVFSYDLEYTSSVQEKYLEHRNVLTTSRIWLCFFIFPKMKQNNVNLP